MTGFNQKKKLNYNAWVTKATLEETTIMMKTMTIKASMKKKSMKIMTQTTNYEILLMKNIKKSIGHFFNLKTEGIHYGIPYMNST